MIRDGHDTHCRLHVEPTDPRLANSGPLNESKAVDVLNGLGQYVRLSKLHREESIDISGRHIIIAHFEQEVLAGALMTAIVAFLKECPHLRTLFGGNRRLPRLSLVVPSVHVSVIAYIIQEADH